MTYFSRALYISGSNFQKSLAVSQVFSSYYKRVVAGLRLKNDIYINLAINANNGTFSSAAQTVDSDNNSIDLFTHGK